MFYAIIENGGKQYKAVEGESLEVDLLPLEIGKKKTFDQVLMLVNDSETMIGTPYLSDVSVDCTITEHFKDRKVTVFKYRAKQRYRVKSGHRQPYTRLVVDSIAFPGKGKTAKTEEKAVEEKEPKAKKGRSKTAAKTKKPAAKKKAEKPAAKKSAAKPKPKKKEAPSTRLSVDKLDLGTRTTSALVDAEITTVNRLLKKLEEGDQALMDVPGIGEKSAADIKKKLKKFGYKLP